MNKTVIFDLEQDKGLDQWLVEGNGALHITDTGALQISTHFLSGTQKATNVWRKDLELPDDFEVEIEFMSESKNGNTMILFNALPVQLHDLFDDPRKDAAYADLASKRKIQLYTVGFHRSVYDRPSVLRKIGGMVPETWGDVPYPTPEWQEMDTVTTLHSTQEPMPVSDKGKVHTFKLRKIDNHIWFWANDQLIHDYTDALEYPYCDKVLKNGKLGFRNFVGPAEDVYSKIVVRKIEM